MLKKAQQAFSDYNNTFNHGNNNDCRLVYTCDFSSKSLLLFGETVFAEDERSGDRESVLFKAGRSA